MSFVTLDTLPRREPFPGYAGRFVHGDAMSVAYWTVAEGSGFPEHAHPHEQIAMVVEGRFEMTVAGETRVLDAGTVAVIPSNVRHSGRALTSCRLIDVFNPVREDYR
jgi:quercetin dioxygenase-like cupin family protein